MTRASLTGIAVTGVMRFVLFLAILGVVASGVTLDLSSQAANPAAQAFAAALGDWGMRIFGVVLWAAAITSVIGAAYTSVSFLVAFMAMTDRSRNIAGAGLGLNAMFGLDPKIGGAISALLAIGVFLSKRAGLLLDLSLIHI